MGVCRRSRVRSSVVALGVFTLGIARAHAQSQDIPAECGTRAAFDSELKKRLGDSAPTDAVHVSITPVAGRYHLRVQIAGELRELDDASCTELFRASVVVAVAMLLHDDQQHHAAPPPAPPPIPRVYPRFAVGAGAGLSVGTLPSPVLALELESKALWRLWGVSANVRYLAPAERIDKADKGVKLQALGAGIAGIFRPSRLWEARLGFAAQRLSGEGTGSITKTQVDSAWAAGPTLGLAFIPIQLRPFWAGVGAEGQLNAVRGNFQILHYSRDVSTPSSVIYTVPPAAGAAFLRFGLVW
jgi:hypothetical protein